MAQHHQNPFLSVAIGAIIGIYNSISLIDQSSLSLELIKVIIYGIFGGAAGYFGRYLANKIRKRFLQYKNN